MGLPGRGQKSATTRRSRQSAVGKAGDACSLRASRPSAILPGLGCPQWHAELAISLSRLMTYTAPLYITQAFTGLDRKKHGMNRKLGAAALTVFLLGCATPTTYFSKVESASTVGKLRFVAPATSHTTVTIYENPVDCSNMHPVVMSKLNVDETIYVPLGKFVTFNVQVMHLSGGSVQYANLMYSVPFVSGDVRVVVSDDRNGVSSLIESHDAQGWHPVDGAVQRRLTQPFVGGSWCPADTAFAS